MLDDGARIKKNAAPRNPTTGRPASPPAGQAPAPWAPPAVLLGTWTSAEGDGGGVMRRGELQNESDYIEDQARDQGDVEHSGDARRGRTGRFGLGGERGGIIQVEDSL